MKKLLFVFNPKSGKGLIRNHLLNIVDEFVKAGYEVSIHPTQEALDAKNQVIEKAGEYDMVVCSGGDGTINEVVSGIMEIGSHVPIGYIPAGSTNDFANSISLPKKMESAAHTAMTGRVFPIDMGTLNGRTFVYVAAFGAFTEVSYQTSQNLKNVLGHQAYIIEGMKQLMNIKAIPMKVSWADGGIVDSFVFGMVTNAKSVGGIKGITGRNVKLDDGEFEVTLVKAIRNPIDLNSVVSYLMGILKKTERVVTFTANRLDFKSDTTIPWVIDGEFGGNHMDVEIENHQKIVDIVVGKHMKIVE